jgi:hypothetical protein
LRSIDNQDNPSHLLLKYPYVDMEDVKKRQSIKASSKGWSKARIHPRVPPPPFYLVWQVAGTHLPGVRDCNAVQFGLGERGVPP